MGVVVVVTGSVAEDRHGRGGVGRLHGGGHGGPYTHYCRLDPTAPAPCAAGFAMPCTSTRLCLLPAPPRPGFTAPQADKLKTFAVLNRTQQSAAKKSSEYGSMPPGGAGHAPQSPGGSPAASGCSGSGSPGLRPLGPRGLVKVPLLQKTWEVRGGLVAGDWRRRKLEPAKGLDHHTDEKS